MNKAPILKTTGLEAIVDGDKQKNHAEEHVFGKNLEDRVLPSTLPEEEVQENPVPHHEVEIDTIKKRKFDTITGEEDEETIFQDNFKLFEWNLETSNWVEKGRGLLKLNDSIADEKGHQSRLIMRMGRTLRIILNVAINSSFQIIAGSEENIRFTDSQTMWAARGKNADKLKFALTKRLNTFKKIKDVPTNDTGNLIDEHETKNKSSKPEESEKQVDQKQESQEKDIKTETSVQKQSTADDKDGGEVNKNETQEEDKTTVKEGENECIDKKDIENIEREDDKGETNKERKDDSKPETT